MKLKEIVQNKKLRKQLIQVMGKRNAKLELEIMYFSRLASYSEGAKTISEMFVWDKTPQGHTFWKNINKEIFLL